MCAPGEEENLEEMLESHELRRDGDGDGEPLLGGFPFNVGVLSPFELLLVKLVLGDSFGECSVCAAPLCGVCGSLFFDAIDIGFDFAWSLLELCFVIHETSTP